MATQTPHEILADLALDRLGNEPLLMGLTGPVGVGKSTVASDLLASLTDGDIRSVVVGTDRFLHTNAELAERGLLMHKGFPDSYDLDLLTAALDSIAAGSPTPVPVYSHQIYDRVSGTSEVINPAAVVIVEGVNVLQPAIAGRLDLGVYLDAPEPLVRSWFVTRFLELCAAAEHDESSFYRMFVGLDTDGRTGVAEATWDTVNGVNLREHILPTKVRADLVVEKGPGHVVHAVRRQPGGATT